MDIPGLEEVDVENELKKNPDNSTVVLSEKEDDMDDDMNDDMDDMDDDMDDADMADMAADMADMDDTSNENNENKLDESQKSNKESETKDNLEELSSDEDSDDDYDENMQKLEQDINKDILFSYHPETKQINFKELIALSNITRNKKGEIIDDLHQTVNFLTRYEKAKILGLRAKQINHGSKVFIEITKDIIDGHTIAHMELVQKKIPFIIRRPIPNGGSEYWKVSDLKILE